jgi:hypothetical protein
MLTRLRILSIGGVLAGLAVSALTSPAAALDTKGTLALVNGIPGVKGGRLPQRR